MFFLRAIHRHPEFREGMRATASVAPGIAAWGLMTGVAMVKSGMSVTESLAMTLLVFAGSSQLAAIPLIAASAPVWRISSVLFVPYATSLCERYELIIVCASRRAAAVIVPSTCTR